VKLLEKELWRDVKYYEGLYQVSTIGNVRSLDRQVYHSHNRCIHQLKGKLLKPRVNNRGYWDVRLSKDGKCRTYFIHRLMGQAFICNPLGKRYINHKNGIKIDNQVENLEWVTHSENMLHAHKTGLFKSKKMSSIVAFPFHHSERKSAVWEKRP